jgi:hypothetical protein
MTLRTAQQTFHIVEECLAGRWTLGGGNCVDEIGQFFDSFD